MRAKTINFERGGNPKTRMNVGGINYGEQIDSIIQEWENKLKQDIIGKTITALMGVDKGGIGSGKYTSYGERPLMTKKVTEIKNIKDTQCTRNNVRLFTMEIIDEEGKTFEVDLDQKIWIQ